VLPPQDRVPRITFFSVLAICILMSQASGAIWEKEFLLVGQVFPQECPVPGWLDQEPGLRYTVIPTDTDSMGLNANESRRFVRQYFPRTKTELFTRFQFVVMPDTSISPFTGTQIMWLKEGMESHGIGGFVTVGADLAGNYEVEWINSPLHDVLPTSLKEHYRVGDTFKIKILKEDPPVLSMFRQYDIENFIGSCPCSRNHPKEGSTVWANADYQRENLEYPWLTEWKIGTSGGHVWAASDDLDHQWWWPGGMRFQSTNPYSGDVFLNIIYYSAGRVLPSDINVVHSLRRSLSLYQTQRQMIRGTIDWAEKLGANVRKAEVALGEAEDTYGTAVEEYMSGEYDSSSEYLEDALAEADDALQVAFETKQEAMFYIYAVEWLVTTGALLLSGSILYSLMVRRRLYREVGTTRPLRAGE
jgi:hypothetical protein